MKSNKETNITIEKIFFLQEKCLEKVLPLVEDRYSFIKECFELILSRKFLYENITEKDKGKIDIIHSLLNDAFSNLIVALKLSLYGAWTEALTLLRVSIETMTIMAWRIEKGKFDENISFNKAKQQIKATNEISELYKDLSNDIVHFNDRINKYKYFSLSGVNYHRIGMGIDQDKTKIVLGELARATLYLIRVISVFYNSKPEIIEKDYFLKACGLETKYALLYKRKP